ncbi:MAG: chromosome segregation protein SMC [Candidatus Schekmanbacteria bacterium]|nr:chromosome segregation protein SMC [Candidatus Schekmanbacteria bacterium]
MLLKQLTLHGFKSFPERTTLAFAKGLTAIVGPNGCGKSNIADAVRWVLGEQSVRSLRATRMEDVLFAGTDKRRQLSMAEVTMVLDNSQGTVESPYAEIAITRRLYRSGQSEYYLNGVRSRLRDITVLLQDTGLGMRTYSLVAQGEVDAILQARSPERLRLLEEAAGVGKYRLQVAETRKRLEETQANLERLQDIISEVEGRLKGLQEHARKARRHRKLSERARELKLELMLRKAERNRAHLADLHRQLSACRQAWARTTEEHDAAAATMEQAYRRRAVTQRVREERAAASAGLEGKANGLQERIMGLQAQRDQAESSAFEADGERERLLATLSQIGDQDQRERDELEALTDRLAIAEEKVDELQLAMEDSRRRAEECERELAQLRRELLTAHGNAVNEQNHLKRRETESAQATAALERLRHRVEECALALQALASEVAAAAVALADARREIRDAEARLEASKAAERAARERLAYAVARDDERLGEKQHLEILLRSLKDLDAHGRELPEPLRRLVDSAHEQARSAGIIGRIGDMMDVSAGFERAIQAALGDDLRALVVADVAAAIDVLRYLKQQGAGRASLLTLDRHPVLHASPDGAPPEMAPVDGAVPAMAVVRCDPAIHGLVDRLLGGVAVVDNIDDWGNGGAPKSRGAIRCWVTPDGDVMDATGRIAGGLPGSGEGLIERRARIRELADQLTDVTAKSAAASARRASAAAEAAEAEDERRDAEASLAAALRGALDVQGCLERAQFRQRHEATASAVLATEECELRASLDRCATDIGSASAQLAAAQLAVAALENSEQELLDRRARDVIGREDTSQRFAAAQANHSRVKEAIRSTRRQIENLRVQRESTAQQLQRLEQRHALTAEQLERIARATAAAQDELRELSEQGLRLTALLAESDRVLQEQTAELAEVRALEQSLLASVTNWRDEVVGLERELAVVESERAHLDERSRELLDLTLEHLLGERDQQAADAAHWGDQSGRLAGNDEELEALLAEAEEKLAKLGPVSATAEQEADELSERAAFLDSQRQDLLASVAAIERAIRRLELTSAKRFSQAFAEVAARFGEVFQELYGGGTAYLERVAGADGQPATIEIRAQPPGKALRSLELLSGGEKALLGIALLAALNLHKPTPFCLLDEVDAPLDENNTLRFSRLLARLSDHCQVLMITHAKRSMQAASALYGVTMEEAGVSKIVSARLSA